MDIKVIGSGCPDCSRRRTLLQTRQIRGESTGAGSVRAETALRPRATMPTAPASLPQQLRTPGSLALS